MKFFLITAALLFTSFAASGQQQADSTFDASVKNPAYTTTHPKVVIDESHFNYHTASGRYKPFAVLITNDGYTVSPGKELFTAQSLAGVDVMVIANANTHQSVTFTVCAQEMIYSCTSSDTLLFVGQSFM
ncbi:MAG TPA: hypothetical protein VJT71_20190 [Pyrinomonadaceae bacterium]|nr:hypothetical protein [Pyrinomonadaceae bacterium]